MREAGDQERERWNRFAETGRVEDYLLYRAAQNAAQAADTAPRQEGDTYGAAMDHRRADPAGK